MPPWAAPQWYRFACTSPLPGDPHGTALTASEHQTLTYRAGSLMNEVQPGSEKCNKARARYGLGEISDEQG